MLYLQLSDKALDKQLLATDLLASDYVPSVAKQRDPSIPQRVGDRLIRFVKVTLLYFSFFLLIYMIE